MAPTSPIRQSDDLWKGRDRLESWKEIATYLRREVRTVQLWEKREGLPVHRHFHKRLGTVFAFRSEIDSWKRQVSRTGVQQETKSGVAPRSAGQITIYVMPLKSESFDGEARRLSDAIFSGTIAVLEQSNPGRFSIVSPKLPMLQEKRELSDGISDRGPIDYVLIWSIQDDGDTLQLNVALRCTASNLVAWSHTYRCRPNDLLKVPEQIAQCLWLKVFSSSGAVSLTSQREKTTSREAYLKGRYFWNQRTEQGLRKAIHWFELAIRENPEFALPYSGLADSLTLLSFYELVSPSEVMPAARRAARRAIDLDPNLAEAHTSLADVFLHFDRDWQAADREYRRSIQCNPDYALGYHWYANLLSARGQHDAAHMAIMHALEINPVSIITLVWAGVTSHQAHQFDDAIRHYKSALELDPNFIWAHMYMAQALEQTGNLREALREFETAFQLAGGNNCLKAMKAHTHAVAGDAASAREILNELKSAHSGTCVPSYDIAAAYAALGDAQQAVAWLNRACNERNMKLFTLPTDPRFNPLRRRSEFKAIVEQVGLGQHNIARE